MQRDKKAKLYGELHGESEGNTASNKECSQGMRSGYVSKRRAMRSYGSIQDADNSITKEVGNINKEAWRRAEGDMRNPEMPNF